MPRTTALAAAVAVLALGACDKSSSKSDPGKGTGATAGTGTGTAGASGSAAAPVAGPPGSVAIFVDGQQVATVDAAKVSEWPRVDGLVPVAAQRLGVWQAVAVEGATPQKLPNPADRYPSLVPALYPGPDGPAFGMFDVVDLAKKGTARGVAITGVTALRITLEADSDRGMNEEGDKGGFDPNALEIKVKGGTKEKLTGQEIIDLPREAPPNGDANTQGWKLTTFLTAAGITKWKKIQLADPGGTTLDVTPADVDPAKSVPFFKLNRQGQLRLRLYTKEGDGWILGGNLRGLASITVLQ
jgi:hypothetical protein